MAGRLKHAVKHFGTFKNSKGELIDAYILWDDKKKGFVLRRESDRKVLLPTAYPSLREMRINGVSFTPSCEKGPVEKEKEAVAA